jgi:putative ABC transport system ATP-binding protein
MITIENIHKFYQIGPLSMEILKGVNLTVERGEFLSIVGTSGCGKSTLMNILGLLDAATSGSYFLDGKEVSDLSDREHSETRNKKIGFAFQHFHLLPRLTAVENVGLPLIYRGVGERERREQSAAMLKKMGMDHRLHHKPTELSGGEQQRVAIARAFVGKPSIILADEPTGALDMRVGQEIMNLLLKLNEEEGTTIIIITHDPGIARQCKRVVRMHDGLLREEL